MRKRNLSATVTIPKKAAVAQFSPGINILCGANAEDVLWALAATLKATGRQVLIAVPHYYKLEEMPYDTAVHPL